MVCDMGPCYVLANISWYACDFVACVIIFLQLGVEPTLLILTMILTRLM